MAGSVEQCVSLLVGVDNLHGGMVVWLMWCISGEGIKEDVRLSWPCISHGWWAGVGSAGPKCRHEVVAERRWDAVYGQDGRKQPVVKVSVCGKIVKLLAWCTEIRAFPEDMVTVTIGLSAEDAC